MAGLQNTSSVGTRRFDKDLNEDVNDYHLPENSWTHARNAINNSKTGDLGKIGNEPSNLFCAQAPYTITGAIHITADYWAIYSTNETDSEIGIFREETCEYTTIVNDTCLNFSKYNPIKGVSRGKSTCNYSLYWADGRRNPDRTITVSIKNPLADNEYTNPNSPIPWIQAPAPGNVPPCADTVNTPALDCDKIRIAALIQTPCSEVLRGVSAGTLLNGSYQVAIAYAVNGEKVSDWYVSNIQSLFAHANGASSLDVILSNLDQDFDEIIVGIISTTNQQAVIRRAGIYSTRQTQLSFDTINNTWPVIPIEQIPIMNSVTEASDRMDVVNDYLIRTGPTSREDFNYQPLANQIVTKWQSVEYPTDYYRKGGNKTNYLRDEVYSLFIRWVYDTGDKSSSYHIPGRSAYGANAFSGERALVVTDALPEEIAGGFNYTWFVQNTAFVTATPGTILPDGGVVVGEGLMGYWESTEDYPDNTPEIWNSVTNPLGGGFNTGANPYSTYVSPFGPALLGDIDLCGKPIRHHKFPDIYTDLTTEYTNGVGSALRIMGIKLENIKYPLMNDGVTPIPGIVGYEILRGTRNGNKTILAKGLINNMRIYDLPNGTADNRRGAYPNYPYNETGQDGAFQPDAPGLFYGRNDPFMSTTEVTSRSCFNGFGPNTNEGNYVAQSAYSKYLFTFHSPDTNFTDPYLSAKELKVHGEFNGDVIGKFEVSEEHPKEKLISNFAFLLSAIAGIGVASLAMNGQRTVKYIPPGSPGYSQSTMPQIVGTVPGAITSIPGTPATSSGQQPNPISLPFLVSGEAALVTAWGVYDGAVDLGSNILGNLAGLTADSGLNPLFASWVGINLTTDAFTTAARYIDQTDGALQNIPGPMRVFSSLPLFYNYFTQGTDDVLELIKAITRFSDFALRYHSHALYNRYRRPTTGNIRRSINDAQYLGPQISDFGLNTRINNLYRAKTVAIELDPAGSFLENTQVNDITRIQCTNVRSLLDPQLPPLVNRLVPKKPDKIIFGTGVPGDWNSSTPGVEPIIPGNAGTFYTGHSGIQIASSHYTSLKQRLRNQYGQINGVIQVPASTCTQAPPTLIKPAISETIFGGDTYVGRYTEKNTFFHFYNWLYGQPDGAQFDYTKNEMIPYPRFWANFDQFETGDFVSSLNGLFTLPVGSGIVTPSDYYNLDGDFCPPGAGIGLTAIKYSIRNAWFYLFNSGVKDFFVESEINIDLRDWGELETEQHYDPYRYSDTKALFDTRIIKSGNYYKYDQSLSVTKLWNNYVSWAAAQKNNYNPYLAETCFTYTPNRVIYSLQAQYESLRDNWRIFLSNNYKDFLSRVTAIKPVSKSGALIFFENESPSQFLGVDQLQTTSGTKLTIGDGGLFSQPQQNIVNTDRPYEYGSCQDGYSVINTPAGVFWMSQNQGKVFNYAGSLLEISMQDLKWWFAAYLPYKLQAQFPTFELTDNPIVGIGCQAIYDNENGLIYFTKRDFQFRSDLDPAITLTYVSLDDFEVRVNDVFQFSIKLGDLRYFEDVSWTVSYDPKMKGWLSWHDWHPNLLMPGKNTFMSIQDNSIWVHNKRCDSYCNYYGVDYPFEIEWMVNTAQTVNTLRSIEYQMEAYKYAPNCYDRFHVLDFNFDEAVVYNTEQCSGQLNLDLFPQNDPQSILDYPRVNFSDIDILYSKEENKYRFNQFWDVTADRGEFNPAAQRVIWNTAGNGYIRTLNGNNLNYAKDEFQRKKFRHYMNLVFMSRRISGDRKMLLNIVNNKNLLSPR
jgi:hypothetical protein